MKFHWQEFMSGDIPEALKILENFWIHVKIEYQNEQWLVWGGDQVMLSCGTQSEAEAFVLGMAINYATLPENLQVEVKKAFSP